MRADTHLDVGFTTPDGVLWGPELNPNIHIVSNSSGFFAKLPIDILRDSLEDEQP